jgi:lipopolysaccharide transport system ATP-binding protein
MNVIEVNNISKKFRLGASTGDLRERVGSLFSRKSREDDAARDFWALRDISFNVAQGESFGIIGHNGSGKSTLLKLLTGIYKPTSGTFKMHGRISALIEVGAGFHPDLTGRENVYLNGSVLGLKRREIDKLFDEIIAFSELEQFIDTPVKRYSSGMYMRLGFAVAAHVDPEIVLVDEVLAVGDESFQKKAMTKMLSLRKQGKTIMFVSHGMDSIAAMCDKVMLLSHGNLLASGEPEEVISAYRTSVQLSDKKRNQQSKYPLTEEAEGTKDVEILEVRLLNASGEETDRVRLGDSVRVNCRYRANKRIDDPAFGVGIYRSDDLYMSGSNTRFDHFPLNPIEGEGEFTIIYDSMPLLQAEYAISAAIYRRTETNYPIDAKHKVIPMIVESGTLTKGVLEIPHRWDVTSAVSAMPMITNTGRVLEDVH